MAVVEGFGTCLLVFTVGAGTSGLTTVNASPLAISAYAALVNFVSLSLFVFAAAPASGGHLNPSITMATFFAGLSTLPRSVIYIVAQSVGAIIGGYWLRLGLGDQYFPVVCVWMFAEREVIIMLSFYRVSYLAAPSIRRRYRLGSYLRWSISSA